MKTSELRTGNLLHYDEKIIYVSSILKNENIGMYNGYGFDKTTSIQCVNPIPITKEWLLKLGVEKNEINNYTKFGFLSRLKPYLEYNDHNDYDLFVCCEILSTVKFVHQLQNLYYALTGEELTLSDSSTSK